MYQEFYEFLFVGGFTCLGIALMMRRERRRKRAIESATIKRMLVTVCK